jgi:lactate permease
VFATLHTWIPGISVWPLTDVGGSIFSMLSLALFLKYVWKPRTEMQSADLGLRSAVEPPTPSAPVPGREGGELPAPAFPPRELGGRLEPIDPHAAEAREQVERLLGGKEPDTRPLTPGLVAKAWSPFVIMALCLGAIGIARQMEKAGPINLGVIDSFYKVEVPTLHMQVERADRLQKPGATGPDRLEKAVFEVKWLTAAGTPCIAAVLISALLLRTSPSVLKRVLVRTVIQMKIPIPTIACMLGLSYVTKYAGMDATLGVAFAETGALYPFFAALLGWLGVFLTGTDAGSNALFGSLQKITAGQVFEAGHLPHLDRGQAEILICTANSTGGVMGKMIDAQSICVATAGTNQVGKEADIFKAVIWHSVFLACIVGAMTALQAFVPPFTYMVPRP